MNAPLRDSNVMADLPPPPLRGSADWLAHRGSVGRAALGIVRVCGPDGSAGTNGSP